MLLASPLCLSAQTLHALYRDRWAVEHLPLAAKQMRGAARAFVHAPETCQRLPALALLAGAILSYSAASSPAIPTGFWDRRPQPTPGRLRRALARCPFPQDVPLPARLRIKAAITAHLPTGFWGQRHCTAPAPEVATAQPPGPLFRRPLELAETRVFNMSTKGLAAGTNYFYEITLNDGTTIDFSFAVK